VIRVFASRDSVSQACGMDAVLEALVRIASASGLGMQVTRTGSRGLHWLEPFVEVEKGGVRLGYGPLSAADVDVRILQGAVHPKFVGPVADLPALKLQTRVTFARCGLIDPLSFADHVSHGGMVGLARSRELGSAEVVAMVTASGLRGRGGAGFPAGIKWQTVAGAKGARKFVVCNADEGDSGTFADRMLMEGDPFLLIEGMAIAGLAVGATKGFVYSRSEYPLANRTFQVAIDVARRNGLLGTDFDVELRVGAGSYVCGEETALLESLEGKRGQVRAKPPLPAIAGLFGEPTLVNNVLTLASVPRILADGAQAYASLGHGRSRGTMPVQLAGNVKRGGLFEVPFGLTLGQIVDGIGGGTASGRPVKAVQCGGPLGAYFPRAFFDTVYDYESFAARDGLIGHGGIVVFDDTVDMGRQARFAMEFCSIESCGKCTPCRVGSVRGVEVIDRILAGQDVPAQVILLKELCETLKLGSLCALGGFVPYPVLSAITHFPADFGLTDASLKGVHER
jgi:formate dehydrogenase iron-sulfur subunit